MIWLSTSLFCSKNEWNKLFVDGILPFLTDKITSGFLDDYTIELNYVDGENIRLSLLTTETNAAQLTKHADEYFKDYFSKPNLAIPEVDLPDEEIPISFPSNTIQFGLYPNHTIIESEKENYSLSISLSHIILDALKDDAIDDDTILTFAFYLQLSLIRCINDIYPEPVDKLKSVYKNLVYDTKITDKELIRVKFAESRQMLNEIKQDIMSDKSHEDTPEWLETWMDSCKE
jgi:hypothetical protein